MEGSTTGTEEVQRVRKKEVQRVWKKEVQRVWKKEVPTALQLGPSVPPGLLLPEALDELPNEPNLRLYPIQRPLGVLNHKYA